MAKTVRSNEALNTEVELKANLASPALTGTPTAPTATGGTNTTQVATTAFVLANSVNSLTDLGLTPTTTELNYVDGVTSAIQTQINGKHTSGYPAFSEDSVNKPVILTRTKSGFYEHEAASTANGWPFNGGWCHLIASTHTNKDIYYSMQFAGSFYSSNDIYYRATNGSGSTGWNKLWHSGNAGIIGVEQTWQNPSRGLNVTYTNSTGKPIMVSVRTGSASNTITTSYLYVNGVAVAANGSQGGNVNGVIAIVPNGSTYYATGYSLSAWFELR